MKKREKLKIQIEAKVKAAMAKAKLLEIMAENINAEEIWGNTAKCWDEVVKSENEKLNFFIHQLHMFPGGLLSLRTSLPPLMIYTEESYNLRSLRLNPIKANAAMARARQANIIADNDKTADSYKNAAECWDEAAKFKIEAVEIADGLKAKAFAAQARAKQANIIEGIENAKAQRAKIIIKFPENNFTISKRCWIETSKLEKEALYNFDKVDKNVEANAVFDKASKATISAKNDETIENFKNAAKCWNEVAVLARTVGNYKVEEFAKVLAAFYRAQQARMIADNDKTAESYKNAKECWDEAARLAKVVKNYEIELRAKINAAWATAEQAAIIADNDKTAESYKNAAKYWDEVAKLKIQAGDNEYVALVKAFAALARANQATVIAKNDETAENYKKAAKCWDEAAILKKEAGLAEYEERDKSNFAWTKAKEKRT